MYDSLGDRLALVFGAGVRILPSLAVGVSAQLLTTLDGSADIDLSVLDHRITYKAMDVELRTKVFPLVGLTWQPGEDVRVGLVWRAESKVRYALPLRVEVEDFGELRFRMAGVGLWLPDVVALAGSWRRGDWLATGGVAWARWSQLPPLAPDVRLVLDDSGMTEPGRAPDDVLFVENRPIDLGARDILQPRAGLEWRAARALVARAGVQYRPTPLPRADGPASYLDAPATTASMGLGLVLDDPLRVARKPLQIDATVGWTVLSRRTVLRSDPSHPVGDTSLHGSSWHLALAVHHDF